MPKKHPYHWDFGIPDFDIAHYFTYFNDLAVNNPNNPMLVAEKKQRLYEEASIAAYDIASEMNPDNAAGLENINSALNFLKAMADSERQKELSILENFKATLKKKYAGKHRSFDKILAELNKFSLDGANAQSLFNFYTELTAAINRVRTSAKDYKKRVQSLTKKQETTRRALTETDYRFRVGGDLQALLNNVIGTATQGQKSAEEAYSARLRKVVGDYIINHNIGSKITSGEDFAAIFVAIALDISAKMQDAADKSQVKDLADLKLKDMERIAKTYANATANDQTRLQKALDGDRIELEQILRDTKDIMGIKTIANEEEREARRNLVKNRTNKKETEDSLLKQLQQIPELTELVDALSLIEFTHNTNTRHGNIYELIQVLAQQGASNVTGNVGTDIIVPLGSINFEISTKNMEAPIKKLPHAINEILTNYSKQTRKDRHDLMIDEFNIMNQELKDTESIIDELLSTTADEESIDDLFIFHESLKLYASIEQGQHKQFHGRTMSIISYIGELYAMASLEDLQLPQANALNFLALNLSEEAVGGGVIKDILGKYFSIFAGLLMFDDLKNMAEEAAGQLTFNHLHNIHLYNLNGVYVPASMVLSYVYTALMQPFVSGFQLIAENGQEIQLNLKRNGPEWLRLPRVVQKYKLHFQLLLCNLLKV